MQDVYVRTCQPYLQNCAVHIFGLVESMDFYMNVQNLLLVLHISSERSIAFNACSTTYIALYKYKCIYLSPVLCWLHNGHMVVQVSCIKSGICSCNHMHFLLRNET